MYVGNCKKTLGATPPNPCEINGCSKLVPTFTPSVDSANSYKFRLQFSAFYFCNKQVLHIATGFFIVFRYFSSSAVSASSSSPLPRLAHWSARTDRTSHICKSRPGCHPELSGGQPLLLLYCPVPATPNSTPNFYSSTGGRSRVPLCIARFCPSALHKRMISQSRF